MSFSLFGVEFSRLQRSAMTRVAAVLVLVIPALYGSLFVLSSWDSANKVEGLPAAIFSADEAVTVTIPDGSTQRIDAGTQLVDTLTHKENAGFKWETATDEASAREGLNQGKYYAVILVPKDFSQNIGTSSGTKPTRAKIDVLSNDANSYVVGQVTRAVTIAVKSELSATIAEGYLQNVFVGFGTIRDGMLAAAEGSGRLHDGTKQASDGSGQLLVGLGALSSGAKELDSGLGQIASGNQQLSDGMSRMRSETATMPSQIDQLADGSGQILDGNRRVAQGVGDAADGIKLIAEGSGALAAGTHALVDGTDQLGAGSAQLVAGTGELAPGAKALADGAKQLHAGTSELREKTSELAPGAKQLAEGSAKLAAGLRKVSDLANGIGGIAPMGLVNAIMLITEGAGFETIADGAQAIADGAAQLNAGAPTLREGIIKLDDGALQLHEGSAKLSDGAARLDTGAKALNAGIGTLGAGAKQLDAGATQLSDGTTTLNNRVTEELRPGTTLLAESMGLLNAGIETLHVKTPELVDGIRQASDAAGLLAAGSAKAHDGSSKLAAGAGLAEDGMTKLDGGLTQLLDGSGELAEKLGDGAKKVPSYTTEQGKELAEIVASPVTANESKTYETPHYGQGMSPFFVPMALWIGGIALFFLVRPLSARSVASGSGTWKVAATGALPGILFGAVQGLVLAIILEAVIGLSAANAIITGAFVVVIGMVFALYNHVFVALLGGKGRIVSLIMLILQLACCAGTYPGATSPAFFRVLAPYLPMTYATDGMRHLVAGDVSAAVGVDLMALIIFGAIGMGLVVLSVVLGRRWSIARLHPTLKL